MPSPYLSPEEIAKYRPCVAHRGGLEPRQQARRRMIATGQWNDAQAMGRRWAIGCVAPEITQRCNLDCTLCYLSENAEAVKDIPLPELFRSCLDQTLRRVCGSRVALFATAGNANMTLNGRTARIGSDGRSGSAEIFGLTSLPTVSDARLAG